MSGGVLGALVKRALLWQRNAGSVGEQRIERKQGSEALLLSDVAATSVKLFYASAGRGDLRQSRLRVARRPGCLPWMVIALPLGSFILVFP